MEHERSFWIMVAIAAGVVALAMLIGGRRQRYGAIYQLNRGRRAAAWSADVRLAPDHPVSGGLRPAGPDSMRTRPRRRWDEVDQASDESPTLQRRSRAARQRVLLELIRVRASWKPASAQTRVGMSRVPAAMRYASIGF
jgi:hypothetical protein